MPTKSERPKVPKFRTEAEEAEWWDAHMDMVEDQLLRAMRDGTAQVLTRERLLERLKQSKNTTEATTSLTIPLSEQDFTKIHTIAQERHLDDAALAAELLSEALRRIE